MGREGRSSVSLTNRTDEEWGSACCKTYSMPSPTRAVARAPQLNIVVTEELIATAVPRDSSHCMIADAVAQAFPTARYISVDLATIRFTDLAAGFRYIYLTPRTAQAALIDFDNGVKPEPFKVQARAAQMVPTGVRGKRYAKTEIVEGDAPGSIPTKVGGQTPPIGAIPGGSLPGGANVNRPARAKSIGAGRRREFGIKALIR